MTSTTPYRYVSSYKTHLTIFVSDRNKALLATYTLKGSYAATTNTPVPGYRWLREGTVLAHDGTYVYPNPSGGSSGIVGVLEDRVVYMDELGDAYEALCTVVMDWAVLNENVCTDGGTFGSVQDATKTALANRIRFVPGARV